MKQYIYPNSQKEFNELYKNRKNCEDEILDYKLEFHFSNIKDKLEIVKDIVSFSNTHGGTIIYGVSDKEYGWEGLDEGSDDIDDIQIKSFVDKYVDKSISFRCGTYKIGNNVFYMITIEPNKEIATFIKDGEYTKNKKGVAKPQVSFVFKKGDIYGRIGSSCRNVTNDLFFFERREKPILTNLFDTDAPYKKYVKRSQLESYFVDSLKNPNIRHVRINGLGGIGKTSFVRHLCEKIYNKEIELGFKIDALVWITGKLNLFNPDGEILTIRTSYLSYREMLEQFANVLMVDSSESTDADLFRSIMSKLEEYPCLVVFDNMETINDERIHEFYKNVPLNCHVIFTSRTDLTTYYTRIDIGGFDKAQFEEYIKNSIEEYRPDKLDEIYYEVSPNIDELRLLTGGSPILINFIMCKICSGSNVSNIILKLKELEKNKKDINGFYNSVMDFCFNDAFNSTTDLEKNVLFAMSISVEEEAYFDISDLSFILDKSEYEIDESLKNIYSISFCSKKNDKYACPLLIRSFVDKKISESFSKIVDRDGIAKRYYEWLKNKQEFESRNETYYDKIKAFDFKRKLAASQISDLKNNYFDTYSFDEIIKKFDSIIDSIPNYGLPYFEKAKYLRYYDELMFEDISSLYKKAIEYDPINDYYITEYAFYLSKNKRNAEAIEYFAEALKLNPNAPNINHGMARSLSLLYDSKEDNKYGPEYILSYFEKGYVSDTSTVGNKIRFCGNAHSHASFLCKIKRTDEALKICNKGLELLPFDKKLLSLQGSIMATKDPNWISDTKARKNKKGIFSSVDDEKMKEILRIVEKNENE